MAAPQARVRDERHYQEGAASAGRQGQRDGITLFLPFDYLEQALQRIALCLASKLMLVRAELSVDRSNRGGHLRPHQVAIRYVRRCTQNAFQLFLRSSVYS
jgi:hypothetical protein